MTSTISPSIIMRTWEYGETDLIVSFFTEDRGWLKGIAKGGRKSRNRFVNCLDLFCLCSLEYEIKQGRDLCFLQSGKLIQSFPGIRTTFSSLSLASYMLEVMEVLFPAGTADRIAFELFRGSLSAMDRGCDLVRLRAFFEARVLSLGGYAIDFSRCCQCGRKYAGQGTAAFNRVKGGISCLKCLRESKSAPGLQPSMIALLKKLQSAPVEELPPMDWDATGAGQICAVLTLHMEYRIGRRLKSSKYL